MQTYKNLFEEISSFKNLHLAYLKARSCKRYRGYILEFSFNLESELLNLEEELLTQTYKHGKYREFTVKDSKKRKIKAAPFRDRIVHHALCNIIEPIFDRGFIYDNYACRKGKGTHRAIKRLQKFLRNKDNLYCLQCDISKYFDNVNHQIILEIVQKKIADQKTMWLIKEILESTFEKQPGIGIPIGNLTSQLFANIYLNELDQFVKQELREKYYLRYMDDFLILGKEKLDLWQDLKEIGEFLKDNLHLELHPKKVKIFPVKGGIDFLGYLIFKDYRFLRKSTVKRFVKRAKVYQKKLNEGSITEEKFKNSLQSWKAYANYANSWRLQKDLFLKLGF